MPTTYLGKLGTCTVEETEANYNHSLDGCFLSRRLAFPRTMGPRELETGISNGLRRCCKVAEVSVIGADYGVAAYARRKLENVAGVSPEIFPSQPRNVYRATHVGNIEPFASIPVLSQFKSWSIAIPARTDTHTYRRTHAHTPPSWSWAVHTLLATWLTIEFIVSVLNSPPRTCLMYW